MNYQIIGSLTSLSEHILEITGQLQRNYMNRVRGQVFYNDLMGQVEDVAHACTKVSEQQTGLPTLAKYTAMMKQIHEIRSHICQLYQWQGSLSLSDIIYADVRTPWRFSKKSVRQKPRQWWLHFINKTFVPLNIDIYEHSTTGGIRKIAEEAGKLFKKPRANFGCMFDKHAASSKKNISEDIRRIEAILQRQDSGSFETELHCYRMHASHQSKSATAETAVVSSKTAKAPGRSDSVSGSSINTSLLEYKNGARVYVPLGNGKVYVCYGFFKDDFFQLTFTQDYIRAKYTAVKRIVEANTTVQAHFAEKWLQQLSLRDVVAESAEAIGMHCVADYAELQQLKSRTIASMVKHFLSSSVDSRLHILTLFLLTERDSDTQYLAYLMYDMISQESYFLHPQPLAEDIYNNLHWTIKKRFRVVIENISQITGKLAAEFNESDINYESRILLMKCPQSVKNKAMAKHKEIQSKNGENASKAQQFLDALLRIPFGIYRKEHMFTYFSEFSSRLRSYCEQVCCVPSMHEPQVVESCRRILSQKFISTGHADAFFTSAHSGNQTATSAPQAACSDSGHGGTIIDDQGAPVADAAACISTMIQQDVQYASLVVIVKELKACLGIKSIKYYENGVKQTLSIRAKSPITGVMEPTSKAKILQALQLFVAGLSAGDQAIVGPVMKKKVHELQAASGGAATTPSGEGGGCGNGAPHNVLANLKTEWEGFQTQSVEYLQQVDDILEKSVHGHKNAKRSIKQVVAQWITGELKGYCFGFEGPPGTGKTSLAKNGLSKCLLDVNGEKRPFVFIALGGSSNGSTLEGHSYTYVGSTWGRIVDVLMETQCMNPIIYIDELDKISRTEHGRELIGILTHMTDSTQNDEFMDKYFAGVKIDLSRVLFVFSYNDRDLLDSILRDRIHVVRFDPLKQKEKQHVCNLHLVPEILRTVGVGESDIVFPPDVIDFIIDNYTCEGGVRKLKEKLFDVCRELNIRHITDRETYSFPYTVTADFLCNDIFVQCPIIHRKCILEAARIGLTNGMYASTAGVGGITIIECFVVPKSTFMTLELTGQQGDVMKESMAVARTVAWNLLMQKDKDKLHQGAKKGAGFGLHLHCPDGGTPKDGPSAGAAITTSIVSCLLKVPVCNTVAMTGEIDLNGQVCQIGGLETKIRGAKKAGVKKVLVPRTNEHDLTAMCAGGDSPFADGTIEHVIVDTIWDVLPHVFPGCGYDFVRF